MSDLYITSYDIIHVHKKLCVSFNSNMTDVTCRARTSKPSEPEFTPVF